jgi:hypothetical protein
MKSSSANNPPVVRPSGRRAWILAPVFVLLGVALAGVWFKSGKPVPGFFLPGEGGARLSDSTRDRLRHLDSPVEIRFYAVLPSDSAPEPLQDFSRRVDRLLSEFQSANEGEIRVVRNLSGATTNADAAAADGIRPFNLEKGNACFLGIAVVSGARKESLARLQPEWEPALEFDLARAILQVTTPPATSVVKASVPVSPEITNEVVRLIPDPKGTSLEEGTRILREAAFDAFTAAGAEMENRLHAAQQQLSDAQNGQSEAEQQAAMKHLQEVQLEQGQKYKAIATRLQAELAVFQQMKAAGSAPK